ncbi:MAG: hypothetical protein RLZ92_1725, partial [Pseudomonadota bacterium]
MALRHLNPINDNAIQLMADPLISAAPWLEISDESLETKAEPAVQPVQALAEEMEVARKKLLHLLLEKDFVAKLLSEQLITKAEEGVDYSLNNNDKMAQAKPVQDLDFVQVNTNDLLNVGEKPTSQQDYNLQHSHIFPVFLLKVAEQAQKQLAKPEYTDVAYRSRLIAYRMNLQQIR